MKLLLLLCATAFTLATHFSWDDVRREPIEDFKYRPYHEYQYRYEGQIAFGIPEESKQNAATRIQALVSVIFPRHDKEVLLRLAHVRFGKLNRELQNPREVQPFAAFEEQVMTEAQLRLLRLPLRFRYVDGIISEIEFDREDMPWSENIKRAVLNMLQVNMQKNTHRDELEKTHTERKDHEQQHRREANDFFTVRERTLEGDCETMYTVNNEKRNEMNKEKTMKVTKTINFEKCRERFDIRYNHRFGQPLRKQTKHDFENDESSTKSNSIFIYKIREKDKKFLIDKVEARSQYTYIPMKRQEYAMTVYVAGQLILTKVLSKAHDVKEPNSDRKETLLYNPERDIRIERFFMNGDEELSRDHPFELYTNKVELMENLVRQMVKPYEDDKQHTTDQMAVHQLTRLVDILRMCSKQELGSFMRELFEKRGKFDLRTQKKVEDLLIDALALAGTKNTIEELVERIEQRKVGIVKAVKAIQTLVATRVISEKQISIIQRLAETDLAKRNPVLRQACLLTAGAMMNAMCEENRDRLAVDMTEERFCPRHLKEKYVNDLMDLFRNAEKQYEKILVLKTLGNAGLDLSVSKVETIIKDKRQERIIRNQAIESLRQLRNTMPRKIQHILLPIYKDMFEAPEIRMTALVQILQTTPQRAILEQIGEVLIKDNSRQVQSFTASMLKTFAVASNPEQKKMAEDIVSVLRLVQQQQWNVFDSKYWHLPYYCQKHGAGASLDLAVIIANESVLPREAMLKVDTILSDEITKYWAQVGLIQYNGENLIEELMKLTQNKRMEEYVIRGKRSAHTFRAADLLRAIYENLNIRSRDVHHGDASALLYVRYMDLDFVFLPLDKETLPEAFRVIRRGKLDLTRLEGILREGIHFNHHFAAYIYESTRRIPTIFGVPLVISGKIPTIVALEGEASAEITPRNTKLFSGMKTMIKVRPSLTATHFVTMSTWNPVVKTGLKMLQTIQLKLPVEATVEMNTGRKITFKYEMKLPEDRIRIFAAHNRLVTFVQKWTTEQTLWPEAEQKTVHRKYDEMTRKVIDVDVGQKAFGIGFQLRGEYHRVPRDWVEYLTRENHVELFMDSGHGASRKFIAEVEFEKMPANKVESMRLNHFYEDHEERTRSEEDTELESREMVYEQREKKEEREDRLVGYLGKEQKHELGWLEAFKQYLNQYEHERANMVRMKLKMKIVGSRTERKAEVEMLAGCDERLRFCNLKTNIRRSPMLQDEHRQWTMMMNIQSLYPKQANSIKELIEMRHREYIAIVETEWGSEKKNFITMKIQGQQNREQMRQLRRLTENLEENEKTSPVARTDEILRATLLNRYRVFLDYRLERHMHEYAHWMMDLFKSYMMWNINVRRTENERNSVFFEITIDPLTHHFLTLRLETPNEKIEIPDLWLPVRVTPFMLNVHRHQAQTRSLKHWLRTTASDVRAECRVTSKHINTFDDVKIKAPITTCYSVLAKDCSAEHPKFAVLMKKLEKNSEKKKMKIIDEERVIELEPNRGELKVKVDGHIVRDEQRLRNTGIHVKDEMVAVDLEDVLIRFDGRTASIKVSSFYKNRQCGLCGHYNEDRGDELRKANNELTNDVEEFHRSYFQKDDECIIDEEVVREKKNYRYGAEDEDEENDEDERETRNPIMRNKVIEYNHEICFSKKPVKECPEGTTFDTRKVDEVTTSFTCIPRSQGNAHKLARRARYEVIELTEYKPSFVETIKVPQQCTVY